MRLVFNIAVSYIDNKGETTRYASRDNIGDRGNIYDISDAVSAKVNDIVITHKEVLVVDIVIANVE